MMGLGEDRDSCKTIQQLTHNIIFNEAKLFQYIKCKKTAAWTFARNSIE
jgi:hypothetical protein